MAVFEAKLNHANHVGITFEFVGAELRAAVEEAVDGEDGVGVPAGGTTGQTLKKLSGADFDTGWADEQADIYEAIYSADISGSVTLGLASHRSFHVTVTGNVTAFSFTDVPDGAAWLAAIHWDATGGHTFSGFGGSTVEWTGGHSWGDLDRSANARNVLGFFRVGTRTYITLITKGELALEPYKLAFENNGARSYLAEAEEIDAANVTKNGDGVITVKKDGAIITTRTAFAEGDLLTIECASATGETTVRIPRYVTTAAS